MRSRHTFAVSEGTWRQALFWRRAPRIDFMLRRSSKASTMETRGGQDDQSTGARDRGVRYRALRQRRRMRRRLRRLDPALDALVSANAKVELVKGGFGFTEGPVWVQRGREGYLLFTDIPGNVIWKLALDGTASVYLTQVGYTGPEVWRWGGLQNNGRERNDPAVRGVCHDRRRWPDARPAGPVDRRHLCGALAMRIEQNGRRTVLADRFEGKRFGGPNDVVVKARRGAIYFTSTPSAPSGCARRIPVASSIPMRCSAGRTASSRRWSRTCRPPTGSRSRRTKNISTNYVNGSRDNYVNRYEVQGDGSLANGKLFIDMRGRTERGITDGLRVDIKGNLYETGPGGVWVISPEGKHLGTIRAPEQATNVGFGEAEPQDAVHRGAHRHLQDQGQYAWNLKGSHASRTPRLGTRIFGIHHHRDNHRGTPPRSALAACILCSRPAR